jgi:hypothetical protein
MSFTRKYLNFLKSNLRFLFNYADPEDTPTKKNDTKRLSVKIEILDCTSGITCKCAKCCKIPYTPITKPFYYTTALIFGAIGISALPFAIAMDGVARCWEDPDSTKSTTASIEEESDLIQKPDKVTPLQRHALRN